MSDHSLDHPADLPNGSIQAMVVDRHPLTRIGLAVLLHRQPWVSRCLLADDRDEAIVLAAADTIEAASESVVDGAPTAAAAEAAQLAAAQAKVAIDRFSYATATKLFDAGGASATQAIYNLDRHWRNARTISTHNPTFLKASAVGDHVVNGAAFPANGYF